MSALRDAWRRLYRGQSTARLVGRHYLDSTVDPADTARTLAALRAYRRDRRAYRRLPGAETLTAYDDNPQLRDRTDTTPYDAHYLHQDAWAAREIVARRPERHVDVGSRVSFVAGLAAVMPVTFVDVRPLDAEVPGLTPLAGSLLAMPFADHSVESLSCLHVAEHVGLGRYGDPLDPQGTRRSAAELARVLAPGGTLLFSMPVGAPRTNFNAHRVHDPTEVPAMFGGLELSAFAGVDDDGRFHATLTPADLQGARWSCGLYTFTRAA